MRSQLSKLPKDILIEIIEKGFNFEDMKLSDLKKKEKEVHEIIERRKEDIFNQIRIIKINDYTTSVSDRFIYIRKQYENCDGYIELVINDTLYVTINIIFQNNRKFNSFINNNIDELMVGFKEYLSPDEIEKLREMLSLWKLCFDHDNRKNMRSEFSKLSKELLIEIIEKGFSFEDLKLSDLKKKEKEVQKVIKRRKEYIFDRIKNIKISEYTEVRGISNTYISICKSCDGYDTEINANALYVTIKHIFQNSRKFKSFINDNIDELMVGCKEYLSKDEIEKVREILYILKGSVW